MNVLVAGSGVLGRELIRLLSEQGHSVTCISLHESDFDGILKENLNCFTADVTQAETLGGICDGIDAVISCIGITRIAGRLDNMAVDYQGNLNLLRAAEQSGVEKFAIISPEGVELGAPEAPLLKARQLFEKKLRKSSLKWLIFHSGGFFEDLLEMAKMARRSPLFVIGDGKASFTPIAVADLAHIVAQGILETENEKVHAGGPETLSWNRICEICFENFELKPRILHFPQNACRILLPLVRLFSKRYFAIGKLLLFMYTNNLPTPNSGKVFLKDYLRENLTE